MIALILGLAAAVCTGISFIPAASVLSFVGLILAIVAWIMGGKMVKANPADTKAKIGKIIGMIITILAIISIILTIVLLVGAGIGIMAMMG